jgi:hypothetical protein
MRKKLILFNTAGGLMMAMLILMAGCKSAPSDTILTDEEIVEIISDHKPFNGGKIPSDINHRLGTTHVGGKYWLTDAPYLLEGCNQIRNMGLNSVKLWFYKDTWEYPYNSDWGNTLDMTLSELAAHPYFKACFEMPFTTIFLSTGTAPRCGVGQINDDLEQEAKEIYELARYLLETYASRDITFVIQNWEGDWLLRGNYADWNRTGVPEDVEERLSYMKKFFSVRQEAVSRARNEVKGGKCRVLHAVEVNKVIDGMKSIPTLTSHVLPYIEADMVSWSTYDAMGDTTGLLMYRGIDFIREKMVPTEYAGEKVVMIGEIGFRENMLEEAFVKGSWDTFMGVFLAQEMPYVLHWELYCNEPKDKTLRHVFGENRKTEEMRGYWLIRPDGTESYSLEYFRELMAHAGGRLR